MAKRGASSESDKVFKTKCSKSDTTLDDVSSGLTGIFSLTGPVRIEGVHCLAMDVTGAVLNVGMK